MRRWLWGWALASLAVPLLVWFVMLVMPSSADLTFVILLLWPTSFMLMPIMEWSIVAVVAVVMSVAVNVALYLLAGSTLMNIWRATQRFTQRVRGQ